jgi:hypothetical protein
MRQALARLSSEINTDSHDQSHVGSLDAFNIPGKHPIESLIGVGKAKLKRLTREHSDTLDQAVAAYVRRRGRLPPKGFDAWFKYAQSKSALVVEEFWDPIYEDLMPLRTISPQVLKRVASSYKGKLSIQDGALLPLASFWLNPFAQLVAPFAMDLPDMDLPFNPFGQPRIVIPWEQVAGESVRGIDKKSYDLLRR